MTHQSGGPSGRVLTVLTRPTGDRIGQVKYHNGGWSRDSHSAVSMCTIKDRLAESEFTLDVV